MEINVVRILKQNTINFFLFLILSKPKCIANLYTLLMDFKQDFAKYRTQKIMKVILYEFKYTLNKVSYK